MGYLRFFLALSVVFWHMPNPPITLLDACTAVMFFFMLSGFYMALTINEVYAPQGAGWRREFYLSRLFRLYPAYLVMLTAMVVCFGVTHTPSVFLNHPDVPLPAFLGLAALNLFLVGQDFYQLILNSMEFDEMNAASRAILHAMPRHFFENNWMLVGQAWSLGSELLFYAMAPFIVRSPRRILICLGISLVIRWGLILFCHGFAAEFWGYNFFPATCCIFLMGSLAYHAYPRLRAYRLAARIGAGISIAFALFALVSILRFQGVLLMNHATGFETPRFWTAFILFAASLPFLFCCWRKNRADRWIGELSYPLYLVHGLVIGLVFNDVRASEAEHVWLAACLSVAAAALIYMLVDRPIDAWRHRRFTGAAKATPRRREWVVLAAVLTILFANMLRLDAFAQPVGPPANLVAVDGHYNILIYDDRVFGIPQGDSITFGGPHYDQDNRLIIGATVAEVEARISRLPAAQANPPILLAVDGHYNLVRFAGRVFGVPQGVTITWGAPGYDCNPHVIIAASLSAVQQQLRLTDPNDPDTHSTP